MIFEKDFNIGVKDIGKNNYMEKAKEKKTKEYSQQE